MTDKAIANVEPQVRLDYRAIDALAGKMPVVNPKDIASTVTLILDKNGNALAAKRWNTRSIRQAGTNKQGKAYAAAFLMGTRYGEQSFATPDGRIGNLVGETKITLTTGQKNATRVGVSDDDLGEFFGDA